MADAPRFDADDDVAALRAIAEGTAQAIGDAFFRSLVENLARAIGVNYAFVTEFNAQRNRVRTLAYWNLSGIADNIEFDLDGTPCQEVLQGSFCHHAVGVREKFPCDQGMIDMAIESYLGVPLADARGQVLGHLAVFDERPMPEEPKRLFTFRIFAARAAAELERLRMDEKLQASEQQFRDLFDEAPIPYVFEDTQTRFMKVNRAAMKLLGLTPEDVPGTYGWSLVAPDQAVRDRLHEAFVDIQQGRERSLPELELRRKDNGQPIWVQFWSKPEPEGVLTRTMLIDITDRVLAEREQARLRQQNQYLQEEIQSARNFAEIVGRSEALEAVLEQVRVVAPTDATVLITGETGTGKELIARAIHSVSKRKDKPLIKVNCAALPAGLVESELFGHEKGAFTGALAKRLGRFELADGGTIFLDEIGELPLEMQAKLLRVLQEGEIDRIGGKGPMQIDVRVIAATNRDLGREVREKKFREDLYYRLNVFPLPLPALRQRRSDIALLAHYFANKYAMQLGKPLDGIAPEAVARLVAYSWPGNIRELENVMERAVILARERVLTIAPEILPPEATSIADAANSGAAAAKGSTLEDVERQHILAVLEQTGWRIDGPRGAAAILELHPNTLRSRMKKLGIVRPATT